MKKIFVLLLIFVTYNNTNAQQNTIKCVDIKLDKKYVLGDLFYGDKDYLYYTVNEVNKNNKYVTNKVAAIFKYDKDMQLVAQLPFSELFNKDNKDLIFYTPKGRIFM